jgi:hypothetical protein
MSACSRRDGPAAATLHLASEIAAPAKAVMNDPPDRLRWLLLLLLAYALVMITRSAVAHAGEPEVTVPAVRRFALVVGANDGGSDRVRLRFATSDAEAVGTVMRDLGGVRSEDLTVLRDPSPAELEAALRRIASSLRAAAEDGTRTQFLFYYSGHSDERGLLLGGDRVEYKPLRTRVQAVPADVRIAILDSCASGAFTRLKGGTRRAPFLAGSATKVEGHAFLTSSSADEAAQESDRVGGSFFTHFLASGLRGAADVDGDRLVTLIEAYEFAFDETLARTEASRGGAQHAAYDIQLAGSGDLVMTDLRKTSATLTLKDDLGGRVYVRESGGKLAAELYKPRGSGAVDLALEDGRYQITVDDGDLRYRADVDLPRKGRAKLGAADLRIVVSEPIVMRGGDDDELLEVPFDIGLVPPASIAGGRARRAGRPRARVASRASFGFLWNRTARIDGITLGGGASFVDEELHGVQGSLGVAITRGRVEGWQFGQMWNHAGKLFGAQTGLVNSAREVDKGAQLGLVNVGGRVRGAQVGVITWADDADAALGLLTLTRKGNVHPELSTSDVAGINLALRFPARYTYSMFTMGVHPAGRGQSWLVGFGLGAHAPFHGRFFLDVDVVGPVVLQKLKVSREPAGLAQLRLMFGWQPLERLAIFGGPTLSVLAHDDDTTAQAAVPFDDQVQRPGYGWVVADIHKPHVRLRIWPGFVAGVRF